MVPFTTIWRYLTTDYPARIRMRNLGGSLAMLMTLGVLLAAVTTWNPRRVVVAITGTAVGIELWQLLVATGRSVDVDDVILNSAGGVVGFISGLVLIGILEVTARGRSPARTRRRWWPARVDDRGSGPLAP